MHQNEQKDIFCTIKYYFSLSECVKYIINLLSGSGLVIFFIVDDQHRGQAMAGFSIALI